MAFVAKLHVSGVARREDVARTEVTAFWCPGKDSNLHILTDTGT